MRELADGLLIPADGTVVLKPGSYHVMLIGLKKPLKRGRDFPADPHLRRRPGSVTVRCAGLKAMGALCRAAATWIRWR